MVLFTESGDHLKIAQAGTTISQKNFGIGSIYPLYINFMAQVSSLYLFSSDKRRNIGTTKFSGGSGGVAPRENFGVSAPKIGIIGTTFFCRFSGFEFQRLELLALQNLNLIILINFSYNNVI